MKKNIFVVTGFLGSGKTTYIVKLLELFAKTNEKSALIINEIGEVGIDNQYIKQLDFNIFELFGGCICCTLSVDVERTIDEIAEKYDPNVIIVEPSGIADPTQVLKSISNKSSKYNIINFYVLDPTRFEMFMDVLAPLFVTSLKAANVILLNKLRLVGEDTLHKCERIINEHNNVAELFKLDFENPLPAELEKYINHLMR